MREHEKDPGQNFWLVKNRLIQRVGKKKVDDLVKEVCLDKEQFDRLFTDYVIANPNHGKQAVGFQWIRRSGLPQQAIRMDDFDLPIVTNDLRNWAVQYADNYEKILERFQLIG